MIWTLAQVDTDFIAAFQSAGEPNQAVIDAYMCKLPARRRHQPERASVKRWHYLMQDNPRIGLTSLGMPLEQWQGGAFFLVGTREIIGEFAGNREVAGLKGFHLKMQPLRWMTGQADYLRFASGAQLLAEISEQVLDRQAAERVQRETRKKYEWHRNSF